MMFQMHRNLSSGVFRLQYLGDLSCVWLCSASILRL